ncbi:hypothetical protein ANN_00197 [Periplaneta americana]|uniref:NACHT domain-containing protein n=1 Tax=Periplaneta americana TaxID=6978 RepID=A0ABQ8TRR6_PERAM|nr:hypothetical protein ANN_00197 [Periplaneta americana]
MCRNFVPQEFFYITALQHQQLIYKKRKGFADGAGLQYEIKITALLFLRALKHTQHFRIATNLEEAGAFDDIVIAYKSEKSETWRTSFIQLKHKISERLITMHSLLDLKSKGDFRLSKYCNSYNEIKGQFQISNKEHPVFGGDFNDSEYVIFTNAKMDPNLSKRLGQSQCAIQTLLKPSTDTGYAFSFSETSDKDIYQYLEDLLKLKELLHSMDLKTIPEKEVENKIDQLKTSVSQRLSRTLELGKKRRELESIKSELQNLADCGEFLSKISFFVEQPTEEEIDEVMEEEIYNYFRTSEVDTKNIWKALYEKISQWWKKENTYLTETEIFWQELIEERLLTLSKGKKDEMNNLGIQMQKNLLPLPNIPQINITTKSTMLTCMKVCQTLEEPHIVIGLKSLLHSTEEVMSVWPSKWCTILIVDCELEMNVDFQHIVHSNGRLIVVSRVSINNGSCLNDKIDFSHFYLTKPKMINFQGFEVDLECMLTENRKTTMNDDVLVQILTSKEDIKIGQSLLIEMDKFIPRTLKTHILIQRDILTGDKCNEVLAISGMTKEDVEETGLSLRWGVGTIEHPYYENYCKIVAFDTGNYDRLRTVLNENKNTLKATIEIDPNVCKFVIIRDHKEFKLLCDMCHNVLWVEMREDKGLELRGTKGDITMIQKYVDYSEDVRYSQSQMATIPSKVILITAESGMGKSTLVSQLCYILKEKHPTMWVIPVILNDHTHLLYTCLDGEISRDTIKELLVSSANARESTLGEHLFDTAMDDMSNIVVLLDGVDEISPTYTRLVCSLINRMVKMGTSQIWITSRPEMKKLLEKELAAVSYTLLPFSFEDQLLFLQNYWTHKDPLIGEEVAKKFAKILIELTNRNLLDEDSQFLGIPLHAIMMAENFLKDLRTFDVSGLANISQEINLIKLFRQFVEFKYNTYFKEKMKMDPTNATNILKCKEYVDKFDIIHITYSLAILIPESQKSMLMPKRIWTNVTSPMDKIKIENIGIIDVIANNEPHFIHRSFAEYFCALWLMRNYKQNKEFLRKCFCQPELHVMLRMLNYMISESRELHIAVLNNDMHKVSKLLDERIYVDLQDKYGRSALHLASFYDHRDIAEELLKNGANMCMRDILKFDALDYCDRNKSWATADLLLRHRQETGLRKRVELVLLKQNITDSEYGVSASLESAEKGYTELARYIQNNGLDLKNTVLNSSMQTALHIAILNENYGIIDIILDRTMKLNNVKAMWRFLTRQTEDCILEGVNKKDAREYTPFMYACEKGQVSVAEQLLYHGADINSSGMSVFLVLRLLCCFLPYVSSSVIAEDNEATAKILRHEETIYTDIPYWTSNITEQSELDVKKMLHDIVEVIALQEKTLNSLLSTVTNGNQSEEQIVMNRKEVFPELLFDLKLLHEEESLITHPNRSHSAEVGNNVTEEYEKYLRIIRDKTQHMDHMVNILEIHLQLFEPDVGLAKETKQNKTKQ